MSDTPSALIASPDNAIVWYDDTLFLLDQRRLPAEERYLQLHHAAEVAQAITDMVVRGAPAIGVTAAYGVVLAARDAYARAGGAWKQAIDEDLKRLGASRPTAVNLSWALQRMRERIETLGDGDPEAALLEQARGIHQRDRVENQCLGDLGAALIEGPTEVITHCNAGALATGGYGTALGVIRSAWEQGRVTRVHADETRPWLQGARLTAWELRREGIPVSLQSDAAAAARMARGGIGWVIVGADRIAANGDVANKIGTYALAVLARYHGVGFMVAAPTSTIDPDTASGDLIPIEQRAGDEILNCAGHRVGAEGAEAWNPVFDVTPAGLIDVLVTEKGIVEHPNRERIAALLS